MNLLIMGRRRQWQGNDVAEDRGKPSECSAHLHGRYALRGAACAAGTELGEVRAQLHESRSCWFLMQVTSIAMVRERLPRGGLPARGTPLDGFPRPSAQALAFERDREGLSGSPIRKRSLNSVR
ncbi:MAG: nucleoside monophosphate kinase [Bacillus subtilis]|nr:nucleoside monophosphate kinase [Bacillus subtilis]